MESFDVIAIGMRGAAFVAALQAVGLSLFIAVHRTALAANAAPLVSAARSTTLAGLALVVGHQVVEAARLAGTWSGLLDFHVQQANWHHSPGVAAVVSAAGLGVVYVGYCLPGIVGRTLTVLGALLVVASFPLTGHTTESSVWPLFRWLLALHVAIAGYWLGSIAALMRLTKVATTRTLEEVSESFSVSAVWVVPAILPFGVGVAIGLLPNLAALRSVYGALLASKATGLTALLILAAFNRWRVVPELQRKPLVATRRFRHVLQAEYLLLISVLSVTAVMTSLYSWH